MEHGLHTALAICFDPEQFAGFGILHRGGYDFRSAGAAVVDKDCQGVLHLFQFGFVHLGVALFIRNGNHRPLGNDIVGHFHAFR